MVRETELFFEEVLKNDLSLTNFVASDFTMLNGRLAKHYGIPGVDGLGVPQGDAAAGQPSRRRPDDGERAEGDGQRHQHVAGRCAGPGCWTASWARRRPDRPRTCRPSSRTSAAPPPSASSWPSIGRSPPARPAMPRSIRPASPWRASTSSAAGAKTTAPAADGKPVIVDGRRMPYLKGPKVDPADVMPDGQRFQQHRRVQATAAERQGPARPRPDREAADLRHRRTPQAGRQSRRSRRSSARSATRITACGRWFTRSSRASCFRTSDGLRPSQRGASHEPDPPSLSSGPPACRWPFPVLDALAPTRALGAAAGPPRRMVCICTPLGLHPPHFFPEKAGKDYELSPYLDVLKDFRNDFTVMSGLSHPDVGSSHDSLYSFLTAAPHPELRAGFRNTISLDQFAAEHIGGETRFPSLSLSGEGFGLSWTRSGALVPADCWPSSRVRPAVPRGPARRGAGPGPPLAGRPEHPRHGPRPGPEAAAGLGAERPREARRVLHQRPRAGAAPGPGRGMGQEAQAQGGRQTAPEHHQPGRPRRPRPG